MGAVFCLIFAIILGLWRYKLIGKPDHPYTKKVLDVLILVCLVVAIVGGVPLLVSGSGPG